MAKVKVNITPAQLGARIKISQSVLLDLADFWAKRVRSFTKLGKSLVTEQRLKPLSPAYVDRRKSYQGARGELFGPTKSNLTYTGQLLDSIKGSANYLTQRVFINVYGTRGDGVSNQDVAKWVAAQGRPFLGLDTKGKARMSEMILRDLRRKLRSRNKQ